MLCQNILACIDNVTQDVRFALRLLFKSKGFAAASVITLALCIGANTAIFSMLYALAIKPLPYQEPGRIVEVSNSFPKQSQGKTCEVRVAAAIEDLLAETGSTSPQ